MSNTSTDPVIAIIMGSDSDYNVMKAAGDALKELGVSFDYRIVSAHRTPDEMWEFAKSARNKGYRVIIAGAGGAAHLPGMVASLTTLPVIGVPVALENLRGQDSLLSIVQMPKGVPVATVAIDNAYNAGILAARILSVGFDTQDETLREKLEDYQKELRQKVLNKKLPSD